MALACERDARTCFPPLTEIARFLISVSVAKKSWSPGFVSAACYCMKIKTRSFVFGLCHPSQRHTDRIEHRAYKERSIAFCVALLDGSSWKGAPKLWVRMKETRARRNATCTRKKKEKKTDKKEAQKNRPRRIFITARSPHMGRQIKVAPTTLNAFSTRKKKTSAQKVSLCLCDIASPTAVSLTSGDHGRLSTAGDYSASRQVEKSDIESLIFIA